MTNTLTPSVVVHLIFNSLFSPNDLEEFQALAHAAGAKVVHVVTGRRHHPTPNYLIGRGKLESLQEQVTRLHAKWVLFNHVLTPTQWRNLEQALHCRVLDRTALILDIFAARARTATGKLQVEWAQLRYLSTRLVRHWTHLERQRGGIGLRGGPGETQLETDRRLLTKRIKTIEQRLEKVEKQRNLSRRARQKRAVPIVSLVGYTNAGKSSLFNTLTGANVSTASQVFATLDPTMRRIKMAGKPIVLADTVGFIHDLPADLITAFKATLEEVCDADLLLHVIDSYDADNDQKIIQVQKILQQIGAESVPQIQVYNKIDQLPNVKARVEPGPDHLPAKAWVSATTGAGITLLQQALLEKMGIA